MNAPAEVFPIIYPETDVVPMGDNTAQVKWMTLLYFGLDALFQDRDDVFVAMNLFWYAVKGELSAVTAPDVMVAFDQPKGHRSSYKQWEEGGIAPQGLRDNNDPPATHEKALKAIWLEVIRRYPDYKAWVVHNKTVHVSVLGLLARDANADVRFSVAMQPKCPHDVLKRLAHDEEESVRTRVAWNAKTPPDILELLLNDPCKEVAEVVANRLKKK